MNGERKEGGNNCGTMQHMHATSLEYMSATDASLPMTHVSVPSPRTVPPSVTPPNLPQGAAILGTFTCDVRMSKY